MMHIGLDASKILNHIETQDGVLLPAGRQRQKLPSAHIYTIILSNSFCELSPRHGPEFNDIFCLSCSIELEFIFSLLSGSVTVGEGGITMNNYGYKAVTITSMIKEVKASGKNSFKIRKHSSRNSLTGTIRCTAHHFSRPTIDLYRVKVTVGHFRVSSSISGPFHLRAKQFQAAAVTLHLHQASGSF